MAAYRTSLGGAQVAAYKITRHCGSVITLHNGGVIEQHQTVLKRRDDAAHEQQRWQLSQQLLF